MTPLLLQVGRVAEGVVTHGDSALSLSGVPVPRPRRSPGRAVAVHAEWHLPIARFDARVGRGAPQESQAILVMA